MTCEHCGAPPTWLVFAAYDRPDPSQVHPLVARYPAPMIKACDEHLLDAIRADADAPNSTRQWVITPA